MAEGLGKKAAKGSFWLSGASLFSRLLGAGRLLILADILPQSELGLFGMAIVVMLLVEQLSTTGLRQALIQRQGDVADYLGTAWISQMVRGFGLGVLLFFFADRIELFFEKEGIANLLRWLALLPALQGLFNVGFVYLDRELQFNKIVIHKTSIALIDNVLSILLALLWPFAITLVFCRIVALATGIVLSFAIEKRRADFRFSVAKFRELYRFGFWVFVSSLLSFVMISGGDLVTGKILAIELLAVYQVAYSLACMPLMEIMRVIATTMYSALSRLQDQPDRLLSAFLRVFSLACMVSACSVAGFCGLGSTFTNLFLNSEYKIVAQLLPVLSLWGACRAIGSVNSVLFQATGRPALATIFQVVMVVLFFAVAIPMTVYHGLLGLAWGLVIAGTVSHIGRFVFLAKILNVGFGKLFLRAFIPTMVGMASYLSCSAVLQLLVGNALWIQFAVGTLVLVVTFTVGCLVSESIFNFGVLEFLRKHIPGMNKLVSLLPILRPTTQKQV